MSATPFIPTFAGRISYGRLHCMEETNDELQLPVPLGNYVQGKADGSVIAMEPTDVRQVWGLPFVRKMGLTLPNGIMAFQLCVPHLHKVSPERLSRGFPTHCAILSPALYHCTFPPAT